MKLSLGDLDGARKDLDAAERILDSFDSVETVVHAAFYDANANYYQVRFASDMDQSSLLTNVMISASRTLPTTTGRLSSTLLVSTSLLSMTTSAVAVPTTSAFPPSSPVASTTLASSYYILFSTLLRTAKRTRGFAISFSPSTVATSPPTIPFPTTSRITSY